MHATVEVFIGNSQDKAAWDDEGLVPFLDKGWELLTFRRVVIEPDNGRAVMGTTTVPAMLLVE